MTGLEIHTTNLKLVLQSPEQVLAWVEEMSDAVRAEISPVWLARVRALTSADPWSCFFSMVHRDDDAIIGQCGYKGPPSDDGVVEISYGVDPEYQGRGYATEAARALVLHAFGTDVVRIVRAHTLIGANASTRVLAKCGFEKIGEVVDPEDGLVWRWELQSRTSQVDSPTSQVDSRRSAVDGR
jgi:[ribosomal protein S5]-alanine N-acetyltransferase